MQFNKFISRSTLSATRTICQTPTLQNILPQTKTSNSVHMLKYEKTKHIQASNILHIQKGSPWIYSYGPSQHGETLTNEPVMSNGNILTNIIPVKAIVTQAHIVFHIWYDWNIKDHVQNTWCYLLPCTDFKELPQLSQQLQFKIKTYPEQHRLFISHLKAKFDANHYLMHSTSSCSITISHSNLA